MTAERMVLAAVLAVTLTANFNTIPECMAKKPSSASENSAKVLSAELVNIKEGFTLHREGKPLHLQEGLLLRVRVDNPALFMPKGTTPPEFVLGDTVCLMLANPLGNAGEALLLGPPSFDRDPYPLWIATSGQLPTEIKGQQMHWLRERARKAGPGRVFAVPNVSPTKERKSYQNVDQLTRAILGDPPPPVQ